MTSHLIYISLFLYLCRFFVAIAAISVKLETLVNMEGSAYRRIVDLFANAVIRTMKANTVKKVSSFLQFIYTTISVFLYEVWPKNGAEHRTRVPHLKLYTAFSVSDMSFIMFVSIDFHFKCQHKPAITIIARHVQLPAKSISNSNNVTSCKLRGFLHF